MSLPDPSSRTARISAGFGRFVLALLLWLTHFAGPFPEAPPELDPSWQQGLVYALSHGVHFGSEIVFTFGPLGGPAHGRYEPDLFWAFFWLYHVLLMGVLAVRVSQALTRRNRPLDVALGVIGFAGFAVGLDSYSIASALVLTVAHLERDDVSVRGLALDLVLLASFVLTKFSYVPLVVLCVGLLTVHVARRPNVGWKRALFVPGGMFAALLLLWSILGQRPQDLVHFALRSARIAAGYTESQATEGSAADEARGFLFLGVLAVVVALYVLADRRRLASYAVALAVAGATFTAFRASYTFHGDTAPTFFAFGTVVGVALWPRDDTPGIGKLVVGAGRVALVVLAWFGATLGFQNDLTGVGPGPALWQAEQTARRLFDLDGELQRIRAHGALLRRRFDLPVVREEVGTSTVDFLGTAQSYAYLNGLNWRTRPVFQSYATTTKDLQELNAAFLESAEAPDYVLTDLGSILERALFQDDAAALYVLLARYRLVVVEKGLLLLRRLPEAEWRRPRYVEVGRFQLSPGQFIDLRAFEGEALRVRFDVRYSLLGQLRRTLLRAPTTRITITYTGGATAERTIVPGMARVGILMRPALEFPEDWLDLWTRPSDKAITGFTVTSTSPWERFYAPTYGVVIERCDGLLPPPEPELRHAIVFRSFVSRPVRVYAPFPARRFFEGGREFVLLSPGTILAFETRPGRNRARGFRGLLPGGENGDGVDYVFTLVGTDGMPREVQRSTVDRDTPNRNFAPFDFEFDARPGDRLVLRVTNPPGRDEGWDMPILSGFEIAPVAR